MDQTGRDRLEARVRALVEADQCREATTAALEVYGPEVFGFLMGMLGNEDTVQDVFQQFSLDFWRGLPSFQWRSSLRTWSYRLARSATSRHLRSPARRVAQLGARDEDEIRDRWTRTATAEWRKTEAKSKLWAICDGLETEDRAVLVMRIGRNMSWKEIAQVMLELEAKTDEQEVRRKAATLRKRFERVKEKVRQAMSS